MDAGIYATLARQSGLMREFGVVSGNIANASTTGYRREEMTFSEHVVVAGDDPSISMPNAIAHRIDLAQGELTATGGSLDFAVQGEGFFLIDTPGGQRLTRAGSFSPGPDGLLVTPGGHPLLDEGGSSVFVPPDAKSLSLGRDGTLSADGVPVARIGLWQPTRPETLTREPGALFSATGGLEPKDDPVILQGFLEGSNVNPVEEMARMIEVQRAYEAGQALLDREDDRIRSVIRTLGT